jgi:hypothetical protein
MGENVSAFAVRALAPERFPQAKTPTLSPTKNWVSYMPNPEASGRRNNHLKTNTSEHRESPENSIIQAIIE